MDELNKRISNLDEKFEIDKVEILGQIDATGRELKRLLSEFEVGLFFVFCCKSR
jgi:hypothetical protein